MGFAEKLGDHWRGRYKIGPGKYGTVRDDAGFAIRFRTRREAEKAANEAEALPHRALRNAAAGKTFFGEYANRWYAAQDLAASTMQNYRRHIEEHLLPTFENVPIAAITDRAVSAWERAEIAAGYAVSSVKTWRATLHLILADAVEEGIRESNPAARRRGRGRRDRRARGRGPEKAVTTAVGIMLIAERAALLAGRDDEFVAIVLDGFTGIRWGELVGLEPEYVRPGAIRVEWQLYELDTGELHRCAPKDGSYRTIDTPSWLSTMVSDHIAQTRPQPCLCHGRSYLFRGFAAANGAVRQPGARVVDVARHAGVSTGTVSAVLNRPSEVIESTRSKVEGSIVALGYMRGSSHGELAAHWRRGGFATWLFRPAVSGWYPRKAPQEARPVPIVGEPWPGIPVRGRGAPARADACWRPIAKGLTPHGLRHSHKTLLDELGVPPKLKDERMGHEDGSVQARYSHVTAEMRRRLVADLTAVWQETLEARWRMHPGSPVGVLDRLLRGTRPIPGAESTIKIVSRISPEEIDKRNQGRSP